MSEAKHKIVVKRPKRTKHGHHGGSWKIAFADFMTAMMAFFLVMWLLSSSTPKQLEGISEYFRMPLKVAIVGGNKSSMSTSAIPGGGYDITQIKGEVRRTDLDAEDMSKLRDLKNKLDELIEINPLLKKFKTQLLIDITSEGLRIQIVDSQKRPMFDLSSATVAPYMRDILREIGPIFNELPNKIALSGHTDATAYHAGEKLYSNWELSADRANASRRELIAGGMDDHKVLRVRGAASTMHMNRENPYDAVNRRISLVVLNRRSQDQIEHENDNNGNDADREKAEPARAPTLLQIKKNSTANIEAGTPSGIADQMRTTLPNLDVDGTKAINKPVLSQRSL